MTSATMRFGREELTALLAMKDATASDRPGLNVIRFTVAPGIKPRLSLAATNSYLYVERRFPINGEARDKVAVSIRAEQLATSIRAMHSIRPRSKYPVLEAELTEEHLTLLLPAVASYRVNAEPAPWPNIEKIVGEAREQISEPGEPGRILALSGDFVHVIERVFGMQNVRIIRPATATKPMVIVPTGTSEEAVMKDELDRFAILMPVREF